MPIRFTFRLNSSSCGQQGFRCEIVEEMWMLELSGYLPGLNQLEPHCVSLSKLLAVISQTGGVSDNQDVVWVSQVGDTLTQAIPSKRMEFSWWWRGRANTLVSEKGRVSQAIKGVIPLPPGCHHKSVQCTRQRMISGVTFKMRAFFR